MKIINTSGLSILIIKTLMVASGLAISVLGILVLFNNHSEPTGLLLNLKTAIAGAMVLLGIGFLILAFNSIGRKSSNAYDSC